MSAPVVLTSAFTEALAKASTDEVQKPTITSRVAKAALDAFRAKHLSADQLREATGSRGRVGRNQPCPCKSGKKYKNCHLKLK